MKTAVIRAIPLATLAMFGVAGGTAWGMDVEPGANLVANASFEEASPGSPLPAKWQGLPQVYSRDATTSKSGKASLKYENADANRYVLCWQRVPVNPGWKVRFSVWIKTRGIRGDDTGATVCLEWQGKDGKWLGGSYPSGVRGDQDWTRVEAITRLPEEAASCQVSCYVRRGMTGTAWFDDVEVVRVLDPPMRSVVLSPVYRGRVLPEEPREARLRVRWNLADHDVHAADLQVHVDVLDASKKIRRHTSGPLKEGRVGVLDLAVSLEGLEAGTYDLAVRLEGPGKRTLQTEHHRIECLEQGTPFACRIDGHRRLLVAEKPFFPIGMYFSAINPRDLEEYAKSKFNCLMPYGSPTRPQMDLAHKLGLKVIYSIKDWYAGSPFCPPSIRTVADEEPMVRRRVREFRDHPALLAWYLNDELPPRFLPQLEAHQRWVVEEDPNHPTWVVLYQFREVADYLKTFDVIGTDPYPIGRGPASMAAQWTAETFRQVEHARPIWQVPQLHNWANYAKSDAEKKRGRTPTFAEVRSMAWQCICEGATGLVFYSWYDVKRNPDVPFDVQWKGLKRLAAEIDQMAPILLSIDPPPAIRVEGQQPGWLHWLCRKSAGKVYLVAVNDGDGEGSVQFRLPARPQSIRWLGENRLVPCDGTTFQLELPRLAVCLLQIE